MLSTNLLPLLLTLPLSTTATKPSIPLTHLTESESSALLTLHRNLVSISSISQNETHISNWLTSYLTSHNWTVEQQPVTIDSSSSKNRTNVFAYSSPKKRSTSILLTSHIDTVPPFWPYWYNETSGRIGGRGSVDAKASVAAQIIAAEGLRSGLQDDISLLFVVGEEQGGDGMRSFSSWSERPNPNYEIAVFGEPTEAKLVCGHKGIVGFGVRVKGRAAHSGYPWLGISANDVMIDVLGALKGVRDAGGLGGSEKYGDTTLNFGKVDGGVAANVVAEVAQVNIAVRIADGTPEEIERIVRESTKEIVKEAESQGAQVEFDFSSPGYGPVDIECGIDGFERLTVNYGTDVPHLKGVERRFLYGPGSIFVAHSDHEELKKKELERAVLDYRRLVVAASRVDHDEQVEENIEL